MAVKVCHCKNIYDQSKTSINVLVVFGCADPVAPDNTWLKRRDDTAFIGCQASGETWQLRCTGSVWEGHVGNCTRGKIRDSPACLHNYLEATCNKC